MFITLLQTGIPLLAQSPVEFKGSITVGGIKQYVSIKGNDASKPLLLFLHGGPGGSVMSYAEKFTQKLQDHFVVVQWDQRQTGRTLKLNPSPVPLTPSLFERDTREMIDSLLQKFDREKLYLAGFSWGTYLGFRMAEKYPERLHAYVAFSPMIRQDESERIALDKMKRWAANLDNKEALTELARVNIPFENGEQLYYHRKWLFHFEGVDTKVSKAYVIRWAATWLPVFNEASKANLPETLPELRCPVYFFVGKNDFQTNAGITENYYKTLRAPKKGFYWFEWSAHLIPVSEPLLMQDRIIGMVLSETNK